MISILITHYNRFEALKRCIEAFKKLKLQDIEIVVADDCSTDEVQAHLKGLPVDTLILSKKNQGLASNLNQGLKACKGQFILYCQEDFIVKPELIDYLDEAKLIISNKQADMCRLKANYRFPHLLKLSTNFSLIPKFSLKNFYYNTFQYSDNPFLTTPDFFNRFGYFLNNVSGPYGENEYAIRIMKSNAKIAISHLYFFIPNQQSESVIMHGVPVNKRNILKKLKLHRLMRAIRFHVEFIFYNSKKRGLLTLKNNRI